MSWREVSKKRAFLSHLGVSATLVGSVILLVFFVWYPEPFFEAVGTWSVVRILVGVDLIFTLTPCGSLKTLDFMKWLGIDIPKWLNNDLKNAKDILSDSINVCKSIAAEIIDYSGSKNIPIGFNIESVAIRKDEIEASIELLKEIKRLMRV